MSDHFRLLGLDALFSLDLPDEEWLVDGILPRGAAGILTAREKAGKGLLSIDLLACVAGEEPFLDRAVTAGTVAYFPAEEHLRDVRSRLGLRTGTTRDLPLYVAPLNTVIEAGTDPDKLKLEEPAALERLYNTIRGEELSLVILDTLRELHDQPENDSDAMGPLLRPIRRIAHDTNCTVLTNHHMSRANASRGSTAIKAAMDFEWAFLRTDDPDNASDPPAGRLVVEGRWPRQTLRIELGDGLRWQVSNAAPTLVVASLRDQILRWLDRCETWQDADQLAAGITQPSYAKKTIQNELSKMVKETPQPFAVRRRDGRGGPREYHTLAPRFAETERQPGPSGTPESGVGTVTDLSSRRDPFKGLGKEGKFAEDGQRVCVECGAPLPDSWTARYCERHGGTSPSDASGDADEVRV